jgi:hypothetical protein
LFTTTPGVKLRPPCPIVPEYTCSTTHDALASTASTKGRSPAAAVEAAPAGAAASRRPSKLPPSSVPVSRPSTEPLTEPAVNPPLTSLTPDAILRRNSDMLNGTVEPSASVTVLWVIGVARDGRGDFVLTRSCEYRDPRDDRQMRA